MAYIGNKADVAFTSLLKQDLTGASGTTLTLSHAVANENDIALYINNVRQEPISAYTASNVTVNLTGTVSGTDDIYVIYLARAVQTTVPPDGSVSTAKIADSAVDLTSKVTGVLPVANGGTGLGSGFVNGISEADQFRLTADTTNGFNGNITSNLERVDDATFSKIGTGMTESSGIFTFPSTGLYLIICTPMVIAVSDNSADVYTKVSTDSGASSVNIARANGGGGGGSYDRNTGNSNAFVNVTNTSTFQIFFKADSFGTSSRLVGDTNVNTTHFTFLRLGGGQ